MLALTRCWCFLVLQERRLSAIDPTPEQTIISPRQESSLCAWCTAGWASGSRPSGRGPRSASCVLAEEPLLDILLRKQPRLACSCRSLTLEKEQRLMSPWKGPAAHGLRFIPASLGAGPVILSRIATDVLQLREVSQRITRYPSKLWFLTRTQRSWCVHGNEHIFVRCSMCLDMHWMCIGCAFFQVQQGPRRLPADYTQTQPPK